MGILQKQIVSLPIIGWNTKVDPETGVVGTLDIADNVQGVRRTENGIEVRKRNGFTPLTASIDGGGSIAACVTGAAYDDELVLCDGLKLYSYSPTMAKWIAKGKLQSIATDIDIVSGNEPVDIGRYSNNPLVDVAYQDGYACYVVSPDGAEGAIDGHVYVRDVATKTIVGSFSIAAPVGKMKVIGLASAFFVFSWLPVASKIQCRKISTTTPSTLGAAVDVATDAGGVIDLGLGSQKAGAYDVAAATTQMWVAYCNSANTLTIKSWTTGNAAGVSDTYTGINPNIAIGFLDHDFLNGLGYLGVVTMTTAAGPVVAYSVHLISFNSANGVENTDATLETYSGPVIGQTLPAQITGYKSGANFNVFWSLHSSFTGDFVAPDFGPNSSTRGYVGSLFFGTAYQVTLSAALASRAFKIGAKWYFFTAYYEPNLNQRRLFLLELDDSTTGGAGAVSVASYVLGNNAGGQIAATSCLPSVPRPTSTTAISAASGIEATGHALVAVSLDFGGVGLGSPSTFNGLLHVPSGSGKTYDGRDVVEEGFYVDPGVASSFNFTGAGVGNSFMGGDTDQTYQYCFTFSSVDARGRLHRSAPGAVTSVTLSGGPDPETRDNQVTLSAPTCRITDRAARYNINAQVSPITVEVWRTQGNLDIFYLDQTFPNEATSDEVALTDTLGDDELATREILYTQSGELDNQKPPAVKAVQVFQNRLFCLTGDASTWHTKESAEGFGSEFSDEFRILTADEGGRPVGLGAVDSTLVIFKRNRTYVVQGAGPDDKGAGPFNAPIGLSADLGLIDARGAIDTPDGILCQTAKGIFMLDRSIAYVAVEGPDAYSGTLTVAGGASLDSRSMAVLVTSDRVLVRDWQLGQWYSWTKSASGLAGVAASRWRNQLVIFQAGGLVQKEVVGQFFDGTNTAINQHVRFAFLQLNNARVYQVGFIGEWLATTTLTETVTFDEQAATAESKTYPATAAVFGELTVVPSRGRMKSLQIELQETSTTEGFRLSRVDIEVGPKTGMKKSPSSRKFT